jgi:hypothetical protein
MQVKVISENAKHPHERGTGIRVADARRPARPNNADAGMLQLQRRGGFVKCANVAANASRFIRIRVGQSLACLAIPEYDRLGVALLYDWCIRRD